MKYCSSRPERSLKLAAPPFVTSETLFSNREEDQICNVGGYVSIKSAFRGKILIGHPLTNSDYVDLL
jgi:hypothetical protein